MTFFILLNPASSTAVSKDAGSGNGTIENNYFICKFKSIKGKTMSQRTFFNVKQPNPALSTQDKKLIEEQINDINQKGKAIREQQNIMASICLIRTGFHYQHKL